MTNQQLVFENMINGYNLMLAQVGQHYSNNLINKSLIFGDLLKDRLNRLTRKTNPDSNFCEKGCFTTQSASGSWFTVIFNQLKDHNNTGIYFQNADEQQNVTILLHWGMKASFLTDLSTWREKYIIENVPFSVVDALEKEAETNNYWTLSDSVKEFKTTGVWVVREEELN